MKRDFSSLLDYLEQFPVPFDCKASNLTTQLLTEVQVQVQELQQFFRPAQPSAQQEQSCRTSSFTSSSSSSTNPSTSSATTSATTPRCGTRTPSSSRTASTPTSSRSTRKSTHSMPPTSGELRTAHSTSSLSAQTSTTLFGKPTSISQSPFAMGSKNWKPKYWTGWPSSTRVSSFRFAMSVPRNQSSTPAGVSTNPSPFSKFTPTTLPFPPTSPSGGSRTARMGSPGDSKNESTSGGGGGGPTIPGPSITFSSRSVQCSPTS